MPRVTKKAKAPKPKGHIEIYGLYEPDGGPLRYIGKAKDAQARLRSHLRDAGRRDTPVYDWIRGLRPLGLAPQVKVLVVCSEETWPDVERAIIADARASGADLLNVAIGGKEPHCPTEVRRANAKKVADARKADPEAHEFWRMKMVLGQNIRRGWVSEATKARMRTRPDVYGGIKGLWPE